MKMKMKPISLILLFLTVKLSAFAQTYEKQYDLCSEDLKKLTNVDSLYFALVNERNSCLEGTLAPDFIATTINNEVLELSKLKGKVVMLNFWFTRCEPCIKEMPDLNKLVEIYSNEDVEFISFAPESKDTVRNFLERNSFKFKAVANSESIRSDKFKLFSAWPYTILIDRNGRIKKMILAAPEDNVALYYQMLIDEMLK